MTHKKTCGALLFANALLIAALAVPRVAEALTTLHRSQSSA